MTYWFQSEQGIKDHYKAEREQADEDYKRRLKRIRQEERDALAAFREAEANTAELLHTVATSVANPPPPEALPMLEELAKPKPVARRFPSSRWRGR